MPPSSSPRKRKTSPFDLVSSLEQEDQAAAKLRKKQSTREVGQAKAARSQTKIYGHLMETRILLQRSLQHNDDNTDPNKGAVEQCDTLLEQLMEARRKLIPIEKADTANHDLNDTLQEEYNLCQDQWKTVLNKRHQDLRLHAGLAAKNQFQVLDSSFWQQVEATVAHQQMRQQQQGMEGDEFEDAKVYQQMLKDFLASASAATEDTTATTPASYSRSHSQKKKQVDRKASKGRKIRYVEIPKLVNFTFPVSKAASSTLDEDEWFRSLFGGGHQQKAQNHTPMENAQVSDDEED